MNMALHRIAAREIPKGPPVVVVAVTDQSSCERLIRTGARLAEQWKLGVRVLSIQPSGQYGLDLGADLDHLYHVAKEEGAEMTVFYHDDAPEMFHVFMQRHNVAALVAGMPQVLETSSFIGAIYKHHGSIGVYLVDEWGSVHPLQPLMHATNRKVESH